MVTQSMGATMATEAMRKIGIPAVGDMPWGTHFCHFYQTRQDLLDIVIPYLKAGLENNEFCMWVTAGPSGEEATDALRQAIPGADAYLAAGDIEVFWYAQWYLEDGTFDPRRVAKAWNAKLEQALAKGYAGLRGAADEAWLGKRHWKAFSELERQVDRSIANQRMVVLCAYSLETIDAGAVFDVTHTHQFAVAERYGSVEILEAPELKQAKAELKRLNDTLEQRVVERTKALESINETLTREVADRKRVEAALKEGERRLADAQRVAHVGHWERDLESDRITWSDETYRIFGLRPQERVLKLGELAELIHPDDRQMMLQGVAEALRGGPRYDVEYRVVRPTGEVRVVHSLGDVTRDESGRPRRMFGTVQDITERKRAEEALRANEDRYRDLVEHSQDLICTHDLDGAVLSVNWAAARMMGCEPAALLGKNIRDILAPDTRHEFDAYLERIGSEGKAEGIMKILTSTGERRIWEYRNTLRTEGVGRPVVRGLAHDVTERVEIEKALCESEGRLQLALRATNDVIRDWNVTTDTMKWDQALENVFGYAAQDAETHLAGGYRWWVDQIHPEDRDRVLAELQAALSGGVEFAAFEYRFRRADGSHATVSDRGYISRNRQGRPVRMVCSMIDITQARLAETELRRRKRELSDFFENAPVAIHWVGPDGRILRANQAELDLLGYSREEYVGHHIAEFHADVGVAEDLLRRLSRNETVRAYEARLRHKDGSVRHVLIDSNVMWEDGNFVHTRCFTRDITEQKSAEQALLRAESELRKVMSSVSDCLWSARVDRTGLVSYSYFSPNVEKILGWPTEFFLQGPQRWLGIVHPEDRPGASSALFRVTTGRSGREEGEYRVMLPDGSTRWIRDSVVVTRLEDGGRRLDGVISDVHERRQTEEARRALYLSSLEFQALIGRQERLSRLLETARNVLQLDRVNILLADPEERWLEAAASLGAEESLETIRVPIGPEGGGIAQAYLTRRMIVWGGDVPVPEELRLKPPYDRIEAFRSRVFANVPLIVQGRAIGVLGADRKHTRRPLDPATLELLQLFASHAAVAIHSAQLFERIVAKRGQLQRVSRRLVEVQERERRHLARELHDEIGQLLTGLHLMLETAARSRRWTVKPKLLQAQALIGDLMKRVRDMSLDLRPPMLDDLGLLPALLWYFDRYTAQTGTEVIFKHGHIEGRRFPQEVETAAYRIAQEALTNVARHARVREATVRLWADDGILNVQVQDDGVGFDSQAAMTGDASSGLLGMRERALSLGGYLTIDSAPGTGTRVAAELPLKGRSERRRVQRGNAR
jgi:PAS domain S-box-containing protein